MTSPAAAAVFFLLPVGHFILHVLQDIKETDHTRISAVSGIIQPL